MQRDIVEEASQGYFGDVRLSRRVSDVTRALLRNPGASLPKAMKTNSALEALYRLMRNPKVTIDSVLSPHLAQTAALMGEVSGPVIVAHDTTEFCFRGDTRRDGLGKLPGDRQGFFGHFALALTRSADNLRPLGVIGFSSTFRDDVPKGKWSLSRTRHDPNCEGRRWWRLVEKSEYELGNSHVRPIHVMDREADSYLLLSQLIERECRFVIRAHHDRRLFDDEGSAFTPQSTCTSKHVVLERSVPISPRKNVGTPAIGHPSRRARLAKLRITAQPLNICRSHIVTKATPDSLRLNLVTIEELDCPDGEPPVSWRLWTTESIETVDDIAAIVDFYRSRWLIEEFFKALKTGCNYESKQLESARALLTMLGLYIPIACQILTLRTLSRGEEGELPATCIIEHG